MTPQEFEKNIVRHGELIPCKTAFIDAHTPGSNQKENFTIIGAGVSESADQHVHIRTTPGFNIGAAGQPPKCHNSLHSHRTAEVFFVQSGRWRFFWGRHGDAGEVILEQGDIFNIPTGMFRGFENIGTDYGMIMAVLGGDDAGGGVIWAPEVINDAKFHGLVLGDNGTLYDTKQGETLPADVKPMPVMTAEELANLQNPTAADVVPFYIARYWDLMALAQQQPAKVIGEDAVIRDRPGFEMDFITDGSIDANFYQSDQPEVLMPVKGHWRLNWEGGSTVLNSGDTAFVPAGTPHAVEPSMTGEVSMYRVRGTDDSAGPTMPLG